MTNLRNPDLRTRDIRKLVSYRSQSIVWDRGCDASSEWVLASLESETHKNRLLEWLRSKGIEDASEALLVESTWKSPERIAWNEILAKPEKFFSDKEFQLYDLNVGWMLEYQPQQIARFGKFDANEKA